MVDIAAKMRLPYLDAAWNGREFFAAEFSWSEAEQVWKVSRKMKRTWKHRPSAWADAVEWAGREDIRLKGQSSSEVSTREEKMKTIQEVLSFAPSSDKPGAWLKMKVKDDKGQDRDSFLKDQALIALVKQPGRYEFEKQKQGQYWEITGVRFLGGAAAPSAGGGNGAPATTGRVSGAVDMNVLVQNKSIVAQVAVKAAVELVGAALANGAFKSPDGAVVDFSSAAESALTLAAGLMRESGEFVRGKAEDKPGTRTEGGRTYEPVEGAEGA